MGIVSILSRGFGVDFIWKSDICAESWRASESSGFGKAISTLSPEVEAGRPI